MVSLLDVSLVGVTTAVIAGTISFISPCVLPLVPAYLAFISIGVEGRSYRWRDRIDVMGAALFFVVGFTIVFVLLGVSAQALGGVLQRHQRTAEIVGGGLIVLLGLAMIGLIRLPMLFQERWGWVLRVKGRLGAFCVGVAFAFAWTPCIGPVLATILAVTAVSAGNGAMLLGAYGVGLGVPFLLIALFFADAAAILRRLRSTGAILNILAGVVVLAMGTLMIMGQIQIIAIWILEKVPALGTLG